MTIERYIGRAGHDYARSFITQDGKHYRREHQNIDLSIQRVERFRAIEDLATKQSNPNEWTHIGTIPKVVLTAWLNKNNYTPHQWAINEGGTRCPLGNDPIDHQMRDPGVKSQFLRYFLSRDFSKLHNMHVTTKRKSSQIVVPDNIGGRNEDIRRAKSGDSQLAGS